MVQNLQLIQRFKKQVVEHSPQRERLNFWMDIIVEATQGITNRLRFPVQTNPAGRWNCVKDSSLLSSALPGVDT